MTDYVLHVMSFQGIVSGATHFRAKVEGPHPKSCHGGQMLVPGNPNWLCAEGHEIPRRTEWQVEEPWGKERYERWAALEFEGAGPAQFNSEAELVAAARARFLGEAAAQWWEEKPVPGQPGDRLFYSLLPAEMLPEEESEAHKREDRERRAAGLPAWGDLIAEAPAAGSGEA